MTRIDIDKFSIELGMAIKRRWQRLNDETFLTVRISESQRREIESLFVIEDSTPTIQIYNDVLCDILELLEIDYEIHRKKGLILTGEE